MPDKSDKMSLKGTIQVKVGLLMVLAVMLLLATCYLSYRNLSAVVSSIRIDANPQLKLLTIREIAMDLEKAENSVRLYTVTKNPADIKPYYSVISRIDDKVAKLRKEFRNDSVLLRQTDDISRLLEQNILLWNQLLALNKDDKVSEYFRKLADQLDSLAQNSEKKEKGILRRVFSRNPKAQIDGQALRTGIDSLFRQDSLAKDEMIIRESRIASTGRQLKGKFYDLISRMENEITGTITAKAESAGKMAGNTYTWLILLAVSGGLLAMMILIIIVRYVRKAGAYQEALETSRAEAEQLARTKELFVANMSHEIRTPVTAISGFTGQLLGAKPDEETRKSLEIIKSSSDHLLKIIDDILDFSKLQNEKLVLERVDFSPRRIMEEVYPLFEGQARQNGTSLSFSVDGGTPRVLSGDPYRLKQILINLVGNSIKFTKNGSVKYSVTSRETAAGEIELQLEVSDTGIGIDESKHEMIFEDFTQAEMSTARKYGGTGLGLSIVKKLVHLQNGTISIKSKRNQGTVISCIIPYRKGSGSIDVNEGKNEARDHTELAGLKVLVVDDEEYNRLLFRKILEKWNIEVSEASSGMDALELLKTNRYDLLFMDMLMPGLDGLKATKFIRDEMKIGTGQMPVIFISAASIDEEAEKFRNAGINAFLRKPFTEEMLLDAVTGAAGKGSEPEAHAARVDAPETGPLKEDGINLGDLYHIAAGDRDFVRQMLLSFEDTTRKGLKEIESAIGNGNWDQVAESAHRLLPPCRHLGAMELFNLLHEIEKNSRERISTDSLGSLTERSVIEFGRVCKLLEGHMAKMA